ncbi:MAG TPA: tungsten ABC transporter substrate-binding protein [Crenotrichaceae bacterium]|nr:tungsten ABC transporter substrate-binding protein [Crenotrichaceae bacterium]
MASVFRALSGLLLLFSVALPAQADIARLRLATTTSTDNSGLLAWLHPLFEETTGIKIDVIAVGTGKALKLGENGDVDVVLVHAPRAEKQFVESGHGVLRHAVMHNDFVMIGPVDDPARIRTAKSVFQAMKRIAVSKKQFISRGDDSGTHKKEKIFWETIAMKPHGGWYISAGQGMGAVIIMANEKRAYTLADRGTYLAFKDKIDLDILFQGDPPLQNPYHAIAVNPEKHPHVSFSLAKQYIEFLTSRAGQLRIAEFRVNNESLFYPDVLTEKSIY